MSGFNGVMHMQVQQGLQGMVKGRLMLQVGANSWVSHRSAPCMWIACGVSRQLTGLRPHLYSVMHVFFAMCLEPGGHDRHSEGLERDEDQALRRHRPRKPTGHISHSLTHRFTGSGAHLLAKLPSIKSPGMHI